MVSVIVTNADTLLKQDKIWSNLMTDKQQFIADWLKDNPDDDMSDAMDAWKDEIKFINHFHDWDNQLDWEDD
jgi:hypothetical protein